MAPVEGLLFSRIVAAPQTSIIVIIMELRVLKTTLHYYIYVSQR